MSAEHNEGEAANPLDELPEANAGYDERRRRSDYRLVFDSEAGQRVLADLARFAHLGHPSYVRGDAMETAFREGERNVVLRILALRRLRVGVAGRSSKTQAAEGIDLQQKVE